MKHNSGGIAIFHCRLLVIAGVTVYLVLLLAVNASAQNSPLAGFSRTVAPDSGPLLSKVAAEPAATTKEQSEFTASPGPTNTDTAAKWSEWLDAASKWPTVMTAERQADLFVSFYKLGNIAKSQRDFLKAGEWFGKGQAVIQPLQTEGRLPAQRKDWPTMLDNEIAACKNAEKVIADIEFAFTQPHELISELLFVRQRALLHRKQPEGAIATSERFAQWAEQLAKDREFHSLQRGLRFCPLCSRREAG